MEALALSENRSSVLRTRGRPTTEIVAQIDREIIDTAREQFFEHGYAGTSMAMIVKAAGVSKTTLYARYATKMELFQATVLQTVDQLTNLALHSENRKVQSLADGLFAFGDTAMRTCLAPLWANYERLAYAEGLQFPELADAVANRVSKGIETISGFIADCAERDGIPCRNPHAIATVYIMAVRGYHASAILRAGEPSIEDRTAWVRDLVDKLIPGRSYW
jgi:AcrR family transcriptional regulator